MPSGWTEAPLLYGLKLGNFLAMENRGFWSDWELDMGPRCPIFAVTKGQIKSLPVIQVGSHYEAYGCWLFPVSEKMRVVS